MLDFEKVAGRVTIVVPIAHLLTCGLYMAGYSNGFGGNIGGVFSASDFFTITIQHLIMVYVLGLGMPLAAIFLRHRTGNSYAADLIAVEDDPIQKASLIRLRGRVVAFTDWGLPAVGLLMLAMLIYQIETGGMRMYYLTFDMIVLALLPAWWRLTSRLGFYGLPVELAWSVLSFAVGVFGLGMDTGDLDRRLPYKALVDGHMHCGKQIILSPVGNRFISVTPNELRHLVDDECKIHFDFVPSRIIGSPVLTHDPSTKRTTRAPAVRTTDNIKW